MPTISLSDLQGRTYERLEDNTDLYPAAEVTGALNEQIRVFNLFTGFLQGEATVTSVANSLIYDVPDAILVPLSVDFGNRQLSRSSLAAMSMRWRNWWQHTSRSIGPVADWVPLGLDKFAIHPRDATGGTTISVTGIKEPTLLAVASDVIALPDEYAEALVEMAALTLQLKEGGAVFANASELYQKFLHKVKEWERWSEVRHPRFFVEKEQAKAG